MTPRPSESATATRFAIARQRQKPWLWGTLVVYAILQLLYLTATPLQQITLPDNFPPTATGEPRTILTGIGPDEKEYLVYILSLAEQGKLPAPSPKMRHAPEDYVSYQAQHPPLFFAIAALLYKIVTPLGAAAFWFVLRSLCAVCGAVVVVISARAAALAFPNRPLVYLGAAPFAAFVPMFGHITANVSNEPLAMVFTALAWLQMVRLLRAESPPTVRDGALLGLTLGTACLTRLTALMWLPAMCVALLWSPGGRRRASPATLAAFAGVFLLLLLPWFVRNQIVYDSPLLRTFARPMLANVTLGQYLADTNQALTVPGQPRPFPITPLYTALWYASTAWFPYWLVQFYLPPAGLRSAPAYQALFLVGEVVVALLLFLHVSRSQRGESGTADDGPAARPILWAAGLTLTFCVLLLLQQQLYSDWNVVNSPGRYIVAALPGTTVLFLFALSTPVRLQTEKAQQTTAVVVAVLLLGFDLSTAMLVRHFYNEHPTQDAIQPIVETP